LDELELALEPGQIERLRSLFLMARRGVGRVLRTADKLNRAGQLAGARVEWAKTAHDVRMLVRDAAREAEELEARRGIVVAITVPDAACLAVVDDDWLTAAVGELVINAIRHAQKAVSVEMRVDDDAVEIVVMDDGPGFIGPTVDRFEEPPDRRGLGLSLPLARDVATAHGGALTVIPRGAAGDDAGAGARGARVVMALPKTGQAAS
jgi:signal transduction histidine kinase